MSAPSTSGLSVGLLLRVIDVKYGCLLYFTLLSAPWAAGKDDMRHCFLITHQVINYRRISFEYKAINS